MWNWIQELDRILRGEKTRVESLQQGTIDIRLGGLCVVILLLGAFYGACMGTFSLLRADGPSYEQLLASTVKVPLLFLLTLVITFPSLYVFNALVGSRLMVIALLKLLVAALGVTLAMLAAFGTIVAFFSVSTDNYSFMVLLNVLVFAVSGILGLKFLLQTLHRLTVAERETAFQRRISPPTPIESAESSSEDAAEITDFEPEGPLERMEGHVLGGHVKTVFRCWVIVFGLVGAQMGWVLRPFIGDPNIEFTWFRPRESNFFESVWQALLNLFG